MIKIRKSVLSSGKLVVLFVLTCDLYKKDATGGQSVAGVCERF